jgi:FKBP-type peptidyl-prolyl cis-trans isomerase FkpA
MRRYCQKRSVPVKPLLAAVFTLSCALALAQTPPAVADKSSTPAADASVVTASGLRFLSMHEGTGGMPTAADTVRVHYRGTLASGQEFDSSYKRGQPAEFRLNQVIPCWTEGVQLMHVGGRAHLTCPPEIAYGARGAGGVIPPNATLQFEIELLGIISR